MSPARRTTRRRPPCARRRAATACAASRSRGAARSARWATARSRGPRARSPPAIGGQPPPRPIVATPSLSVIDPPHHAPGPSWSTPREVVREPVELRVHARAVQALGVVLDDRLPVGGDVVADAPPRGAASPSRWRASAPRQRADVLVQRRRLAGDVDEHEPVQTSVRTGVQAEAARLEALDRRPCAARCAACRRSRRTTRGRGTGAAARGPRARRAAARRGGGRRCGTRAARRRRRRPRARSRRPARASRTRRARRARRRARRTPSRRGRGARAPTPRPPRR